MGINILIGDNTPQKYAFVNPCLSPDWPLLTSMARVPRGNHVPTSTYVEYGTFLWDSNTEYGQTYVRNHDVAASYVTPVAFFLITMCRGVSVEFKYQP
jgi:hypothetical protein